MGQGPCLLSPLPASPLSSKVKAACTHLPRPKEQELRLGQIKCLPTASTPAPQPSALRARSHGSCGRLPQAGGQGSPGASLASLPPPVSVPPPSTLAATNLGFPRLSAERLGLFRSVSPSLTLPPPPPPAPALQARVLPRLGGPSAVPPRGSRVERACGSRQRDTLQPFSTCHSPELLRPPRPGHQGLEICSVCGKSFCGLSRITGAATGAPTAPSAAAPALTPHNSAKPGGGADGGCFLVQSPFLKAPSLSLRRLNPLSPPPAPVPFSCLSLPHLYALSPGPRPALRDPRGPGYPDQEGRPTRKGETESPALASYLSPSLFPTGSPTPHPGSGKNYSRSCCERGALGRKGLWAQCAQSVRRFLSNLKVP